MGGCMCVSWGPCVGVLVALCVFYWIMYLYLYLGLVWVPLCLGVSSVCVCIYVSVSPVYLVSVSVSLCRLSVYVFWGSSRVSVSPGVPVCVKSPCTPTHGPWYSVFVYMSGPRVWCTFDMFPTPRGLEGF